ncbi:uncharacterized protein ATNIH1004_004264 [Aspergillus tanneri]|uniref:Uncharacterized protein n=1 Tax=Aspergillus tanneri TaxID=1220188 RepID=A0A5M9MUS5_9EURO|nr:uncharacterized protein ATNIH1004_004264 [Aspergillus tanneri]KAA8648379.1 hypothetical protein ATNIH1004_004264 [Aspergillus tanneri]
MKKIANYRIKLEVFSATGGMFPKEKQSDTKLCTDLTTVAGRETASSANEKAARANQFSATTRLWAAADVSESVRPGLIRAIPEARANDTNGLIELRRSGAMQRKETNDEE